MTIYNVLYNQLLRPSITSRFNPDEKDQQSLCLHKRAFLSCIHGYVAGEMLEVCARGGVFGKYIDASW